MSVTIKGDKDLERKLLSLGADMREALSEGILITAHEVRTTAIKSIQEHSVGSFVKRSRQGGGTYDHVASAPGSAPNTDTGALVSSIAVEMDNEKIEAEIGSNLKYGYWLEFGTKKNLAPRPWLNPALNANRDNLMSNIKKAVMNRIKKAKK